MIARARRVLGTYDRAETMIQAGLYDPGSDAAIDEAIRLWPGLDAFLSEDAPDGIAGSFARLESLLEPDDAAGAASDARGLKPKAGLSGSSPR
ncbi:hypothetical protein DDZ14_09860 [Maritimibacter sp. 55A14]|uniref:hypothetical protein n=1 Tax=Maritimibacter sp. 55A14 TaxID=2174844 RepID=UPI000D61D1AC|nr:hypothetical protein [Maritimibacter sp. 55A14]PWE32367.1 hypothetical protein DDZ14_09860 [Maritimibacter sp. 55A14]